MDELAELFTANLSVMFPELANTEQMNTYQSTSFKESKAAAIIHHVLYPYVEKSVSLKSVPHRQP